MPKGKGRGAAAESHAGGGGGTGDAGGGVSVTTLDELARHLTSAAAPGEAMTLVAWSDHPSVLLLRFPTNGMQKAAMARLSAFLEDKEHRGTVVEHLERGKAGGALAYTGHNFRAADAARFFMAAAAARVALSPEEQSLRSALLAQRVLVTVKGGGLTAPRPYGVLAVARGFERDEARETLLHEAMHGLFYTCAPFEAACWSFWRTSLSEAQRELWRAFLGGLGYDGDNEELAVNEFQAYMSTERKLWGDGSGKVGAAKGGKGAGGKGGARKGSDDSGEAAALQAMQGSFGAFIAPHVPQPLPCCAGCACVFVVR